MNNFRTKVKSKMKDRLWLFGTSVLIALLVLVSYQSFLYAAKLDAKDRQINKVAALKTAEWNTIEVIIKDTIDKAGKKLDNEIIPSIIEDIHATYGEDKEALQFDLMNLSNKDHINPLIHLLADNIIDEYLYDIKTDSNDIFIMTKKDGIISDPSISSSSPDRPRSISQEVRDHYNPKLAEEAFNMIINQSRRLNDPIIFWQFFNPSTDDEIIDQVKISELKNIFHNSGGKLESLDSYEFLVPRYIFFDSDILGNPLVDDRGIRNDIYQIIVVQSFSITEVISNSSLFESIYSGFTNEQREIDTSFTSISRIQQILIFIGLVVIVAFLQFSVKARRKYFDQ